MGGGSGVLGCGGVDGGRGGGDREVNGGCVRWRFFLCAGGLGWLEVLGLFVRTMVDMSIMELPAFEAAEGSSSIVPVFGPDDEAADDEEDEAESELDSLEESDEIEGPEGGGLRAGGLGRSGGEGLSSMRWSLTELCDWVAAIMCWVGRSGGATYGAFGLSLLWGSEGGGCGSCRLWVFAGGVCDRSRLFGR